MPVPNTVGPQSHAVLSSSLQYGIVARSFPFSGRILRGYLDAAGTLNGLGIGNPNAEFSPDLMKCAMTSDGGTAKVLWGFRNGSVAVTNAPKAMEGARPVSARWTKCQLDDAHDGAVEDAVWAGIGSTYAVTAGADGRVKLWEAKRMACLWTSPLKSGQLLKDPCVKVAADLNGGVIAGLMKSGELIIWSGLTGIVSGDVSPSEIHDPLLYRTTVDIDDGDIERSIFGDSSAAAVTSLQPVFATNPDEPSFVIVGDKLGYVSVFPWDASGSTVAPNRRFQAHGDSAVSAIAWSPAVVVTGSSKGTIRAFDSLNFACLRTFPATGRPAIGEAPDPVSNVVVDREALAASIGSRVMGWFAGPVGRERTHHKGRHAKSSKSHPLAKWQQQVELYRDIAESRQELEHEQAHTRRTFGREREQQSTLAHLGLNEVEAVEYVLMLSREEEELRRRARAVAANADEGVFFDDFDDVSTPLPTEEHFFDSPIAGPSRATSSHHSVPSRGSRSLNGRALLHVVEPSSHKVHVSPRHPPEPLEAGPSISPNDSLPRSVSSSSSLSSSTPSPDDPLQFPSVSSTPIHRSVPGSVGSGQSAWSTPLRRSESVGGSSSPRATYSSVASSPAGEQHAFMQPSSLSSRLGNLTMGPSTSASARTELEDREAEELRFAIELSLAEARSRGEDI
ncbi:unnamed protein product [Somion occarium]|uniref:Uncharacterized protein n=1 Tax=Somion occarium TaxID=3059160 RepID=A0ABP1CSH6_9APHY